MKHFPFVVAAVVGFPFCAEIFSTHVAGSSFFFYDWRRFLLEVAAVAACGMLARTFGFCLPCLPLPTSLTTLSHCPSVVAHMRRMRLLFQRRTHTSCHTCHTAGAEVAKVARGDQQQPRDWESESENDNSTAGNQFALPAIAA